MRRRKVHQADLFLIVEPPENKLPSSQRPRVVQLLGELMWNVLELRTSEAAPQEKADE